MKELKDKFITISCSGNMLRKITNAAFDNRITRSKLIRNIIKQYLNDYEENEIEGAPNES